MVLEAYVSLLSKILDLPPGLSFPVDHLGSIQLDNYSVSLKHDFVQIPFSRGFKSIRVRGLCIVDRPSLVDPGPTVIDLDLRSDRCNHRWKESLESSKKSLNWYRFENT